MEISQDWKDHLSRIGTMGGKAKSKKKKDACAKNGALGGWPKGRPRKTPIATDENK